MSNTGFEPIAMARGLLLESLPDGSKAVSWSPPSSWGQSFGALAVDFWLTIHEVQRSPEVTPAIRVIAQYSADGQTWDAMGGGPLDPTTAGFTAVGVYHFRYISGGGIEDMQIPIGGEFAPFVRYGLTIEGDTDPETGGPSSARVTAWALPRA
jgi:hypothetical protein